MITRRLPRHWLICLALTVCGLTTGSAHAQSPVGTAWVNYTNMNSIMGLARQGNALWLATTGGLARLPSGDISIPDRFTNADGLADNDLRFVFSDSGGRVWTGGMAGRLSRRHADHDWVAFNFNSGDVQVQLLCAALGPDDFLWVGSSAGLHKFDINRHGGEIKETYTRLGDWPASNSVRSVVIHNGSIWAVGPAGVARATVGDPFLLDPARWQSWTALPSQSAIAVHNDRLHTGGADGLWRYEPSQGNPAESVWVKIGFAGQNISALTVRNDTLWVATDRGLGLCGPTGCFPAPLPGTPTRVLTSVAAMDDGTVFAGTNGAGVLRWRVGQSEMIAFPGPLDNHFDDIAIDDRGRVWCIHPSSGADLLDGDDWTDLTFYSSLVGGGAPGTSVDIAPNGDVWLGAWGGGAFRVNPESPFADWQRFDTSNSTLMWVLDPVGPNNYVVVRDISVDPDGRVWFANHAADSGRVLPYFDNGCWGYFDTGDNLNSSMPAVLLSLRNEVLIGFDNIGVADLEYDSPLCVGGQPLDRTPRVIYRNQTDGLPSNQVMALLLDRADSLWVGTNIGLARYAADLRRFTNVPLPAEAGLTVTALAADAVNTIWVGTDRGLVKLPASGPAVFYSPENSPLVGSRVRSLAVDDRTGHVWIGTLSGLSRFAAGVAPAETIESVLAYPNPLIIEGGAVDRVRFNAPFGSRIFIFTADGQPVTDFPVESGWDARTGSGTLVASGVYLFVVRGPDGEYGRGKIAVVRRI